MQKTNDVYPCGAIDYIHTYLRKGAVPGLGRIRDLLGRMGNPEKNLKFIHIAGTNGKGSTAAMLASIMTAAGYQTGLFTSPYLSCFRERIQLDGKMISEEELEEVVSFVGPLAEQMDEKPTEFELVTAVALEFFSRKKCGIVVLETGMGGAVDATNAIPAPEAAVICNIGLDHTEFLGDTPEKIAEAKAGIIKEGCHAVIYRGSPSVEAVFESRCAQVGAKLHRADFETLAAEKKDFSGQVFRCGSRRDLFLPLLGDHQLKNAAVVLTTVEVLNEKGWQISEEQLRRGLAATQWPGRFELLRRDPVFLVDGGHNPQCMEALMGNIREYLPGRPITALTGVMADKDYLDMYREMAPWVSRFVTVTPDNPRALDAEQLAQSLKIFGLPVTACHTVEEGVREAIAQTEPQGAVVAFGSLYMVGPIRAAVSKGL